MKRVMTRPLALAVLLSAATCASPRPPAEETKPAGAAEPRPLADYARLVYHRDNDSDPGRWIGQTSVRELRHPGSGVSVVFLSMAHCGKPDYYRGLTPHLRDAEIVLAEWHGEGTLSTEPREGDLPPGAQWVQRGQWAMEQLLGLQSQPEWEAAIVDQRWILADMNTNEMVETVRLHDFPFTDSAKATVERWEAALAGSCSPEDVATARQEAGTAMMRNFDAPAEPGESERTLHELREAATWRILTERLASGKYKRVAIVFGAYHIPHFETKLINELGFRLEATCWHDCAVFQQPLPDAKGTR